MTNKQTHTHFGYETVTNDEKTKRVHEVFSSVATRYDIMNDVMSLGLHRLWKRIAIHLSDIKMGESVLDVAGGSGDLSKHIASRVGKDGQIALVDINYDMLKIAQNKLLNAGILPALLQCNAEQLPFCDNHFDCVIISFGLRNITHQDIALQEMVRVLKPHGRLIVLEFSKIWSPLSKMYDFYSFSLLPKLGSMLVGDAKSYQYLAESIRVHPDQETLLRQLQQAGLTQTSYHNISAGIVAVHKGYKP